ncbi:hypothetical protein FA09DRAFT_149389 [Tilletiopsis washingtonensis]|uniref:Uncharacterized protein n=1 Tax=Tilletiopsis washingtonensis TaxID=58919 RepID=A0A316Z1G8_9BASI|nr:hypothetical protein FA09DRAFT_149389 [Tilletiopsis washingtonensis]PWN95381.1 hypothetical protein FA09DRAFT_149389 [Tilletiopsis washingtonensis]
MAQARRGWKHREAESRAAWAKERERVAGRRQIRRHDYSSGSRHCTAGGSAAEGLAKRGLTCSMKPSARGLPGSSAGSARAERLAGVLGAAPAAAGASSLQNAVESLSAGGAWRDASVDLRAERAAASDDLRLRFASTDLRGVAGAAAATTAAAGASDEPAGVSSASSVPSRRLWNRRPSRPVVLAPDVSSPSCASFGGTGGLAAPSRDGTAW